LLRRDADIFLEGSEKDGWLFDLPFSGTGENVLGQEDLCFDQKKHWQDRCGRYSCFG